MYISQVNLTTFQAKPVKKLIPLSEYKGPILKLTKSEEKRVEELKQKRAVYEIEYYKLNEYMPDLKHNPEAVNRRNNALLRVEALIDTVDKEIKRIKTERFTKQQEEFLKSQKNT